MLSTLLLQSLTIINGFVIPRIILIYFGSDVNGLVSSVMQFLTYIGLVEGGVTGVVMANLYRPLYENDILKVSSIVKTAERFYKKIGMIFVGYTVVLAVIYSLLFRAEFSFPYVFSLTVVLSVSVFIQYMFSLTYKTLLSADKKVYIVSFLQSVILTANMVLAVVSVKIYPSIHVLKLLTGLLYLLQPIVFTRFVKKHYQLDDTAPVDSNLLSSRWDGFAINIAAFIHNATDIAVLTVFTDFKTVSIYSVHALVTAGLKQIVTALSTGIAPAIGAAYAKNDRKELNEKMDLYEYIIFSSVFFLFTVGGLLITPFVMIYTRGIQDADYSQPVFAVLLLLAEAVYLLKSPHLDLAYAANQFTKIRKPAYMEAGLNLLISLILVKKFGLIGVALGTVCAMIFRLCFHVRFTKKLIPDRKQWIFYRKLLLFTGATVVGLVICCFIPFREYSIINWCSHAVLYSVIFLVLYFGISLLCFKKELRYFKDYLKLKKGRKTPEA